MRLDKYLWRRTWLTAIAVLPALVLGAWLLAGTDAGHEGGQPGTGELTPKGGAPSAPAVEPGEVLKASSEKRGGDALALAMENGVFLFQPSSSKHLARVLRAPPMEKHYPSKVANLAPAGLPADLAACTAQQRKALFIRSLMPMILAENRRIRQQRSMLGTLHEQLEQDELLDHSSRAALQALAQEYNVRIGESLATPERARDLIAKLQLRVDTIPPSLALAQAAIESAWGTSRFARQGNSLFGQWLFGAGEGLVPSQRSTGADHRVASFSNLARSIRAYLRNLNSGWAYASFREVRARQRQADGQLDSLLLAAELIHYSARGYSYTQELQSIIEGNMLQRHDQARLVALANAEAAQLALQFEHLVQGNARIN